jgi:prophage regulatory protein
MTRNRPAAQVEFANKAADMAAASQVRLISKPEVCDRVGRTFPTIWLWMRQGKFPLPRDLGGKPAWVESEVDAWIERLPTRKYKPADDTVAA